MRTSLLQRVILPRPGEPQDVRTLYLLESETNTRRPHAASRTTLDLVDGTEVSFETYFNAFNAGYWRRWTVLNSVVLRLQVTGACRVTVYRSKPDGARVAVASEHTNADGSNAGVVEVTVDLSPFEDGGWIWFDLTTDTDVRIESAGWYAPTDAPGGESTRRVTVGIPTFNRPADAVSALAALSSDPEVVKVLDAVLMVDQGTTLVQDHSGYPEAAAALGDRFQLFRQGNLGGSGGYSRIMYEALTRTDSPYILFMDDDIVIEPDSILRALALSRFAKTPMLVGGQMLNLQERSHLHTMGEVVDPTTFMWTAAPNSHYDHDFAAHPLRATESRDLHRRVDVDFNGWWMCMIPRICAEQIGQPLPLFIKWDDVEYGLRARSAGYPTVTMPGIAIWHMAWSDKDDAIDWQAYFHLRNRLVVAALHQPGDHQAMIRSSWKATLKHLLCLEYSTVAIQNEALRDFLAGPEHLFDLLPTARPKITALRTHYPDAQVVRSVTELPRTSGEATTLGQHPPRTRIRKMLGLAASVVNNLSEADPRHHQRPQANFSPTEARWFSLGRIDGATVTTADGRGVVYRQRNRTTAATLLRESLALHRRLSTEYPDLQRTYQAAAATLTDINAWKTTFDTEKTDAARI